MISYISLNTCPKPLPVSNLSLEKAVDCRACYVMSSYGDFHFTIMLQRAYIRRDLFRFVLLQRVRFELCAHFFSHHNSYLTRTSHHLLDFLNRLLAEATDRNGGRVRRSSLDYVWCVNLSIVVTSGGCQSVH